MALFMDVHESLPRGATAADVAHANEADVRTQDRYGVRSASLDLIAFKQGDQRRDAAVDR